MKKERLSPKMLLFIGLTLLISIATLIYQSVNDNQQSTGWLIHQDATLTDSEMTYQSALETDAVNKSELTKVNKIPIYLVGAVYKPGIYQVTQGSYLYELIEQAGGLTSDAAAQDIDLALMIQENGRIYIPTQAEFNQEPQRNWADVSDGNEEAELVDINTASAEALDTLPGVGPATAKAIIDYRERNGSFQIKEDLLKVSGIKQSRLDAISDLISVGK